MVSIITVNFRQTAVTCALLDSIRRENRVAEIEVIVVDNGSLSDERAVFERHFPGVRVIRSTENLGFAGGNNLGIRAAVGQFLFFINNDTEWTPGLLENLLARLEKTPAAGVVSPKICYFEEKNRIQYAGFTSICPWTGRNRAIGKNELDHGQHDRARQTAYAHGAAMLVRREVIDRAGPMPEEFFLYYEELDWCERIRRAGFEIWYEPAVTIFHKESAAVGRNSPLKTFFQTRNRLLFMSRNFSKRQYLGFLAYFFSVTVTTKTAQFLLKREIVLLNAFWRGIFGAYKFESS